MTDPLKSTPTSILLRELRHRRALARQRLCTFCGKPRTAPTCDAVARHHGGDWRALMAASGSHPPPPTHKAGGGG